MSSAVVRVLAGWIVHVLLLLFVPAQCLYQRAYRRDHHRKKTTAAQPKGAAAKGGNADGHVIVTPFNEPPDAQTEAALRHEQMRFYPRLQLQPESITNANFETIKTRFEKTLEKHPAQEPALVERPFCTNKVTFEDTCLVYIVYGNDICRGVEEKEENTLDESRGGRKPV